MMHRTRDTEEHTNARKELLLHVEASRHRAERLIAGDGRENDPELLGNFVAACGEYLRAEESETPMKDDPTINIARSSGANFTRAVTVRFTPEGAADPMFVAVVSERTVSDRSCLVGPHETETYAQPWREPFLEFSRVSIKRSNWPAMRDAIDRAFAAYAEQFGTTGEKEPGI